jgi:hypothetical protein
MPKIPSWTLGGPEQQRGRVVERRGKGNLECSLVEAGMTSTGPSLRGIKLLTLNRRLLEGLKGLEGLERWNYAGARRSWEWLASKMSPMAAGFLSSLAWPMVIPLEIKEHISRHQNYSARLPFIFFCPAKYYSGARIKLWFGEGSV